MAKKVTKKKAIKPAVEKKAANANKVAKAAVKKAVKQTPAKKATSRKVAQKLPAKKAAVKKAAVKKAPAELAVEAPVKSVAKKATKRAARKKVVKPEDLEPIIVKRPYVQPEKLAKLTVFEKRQRKRLLDLRDQITDSMYGIQNDTIKNGSEGADSSGSGMHQGDAGSDAYDRDFALTMLSKESNALGEIEQALQRLEMGVYGICEESGQKIPQPRLEAMPFARLTVECQAAKEKNDSLSDRSSREFGYN
ncbi:TraR/DksA C4-type zinc finger protein [Verrucomicrobiaceae bacterium 227]